MSSNIDREIVVNQLLRFKQDVVQSVSNVVIGYEDVIHNILIAFLCGGHALLTGLPGLGKTLCVKTLSAVLGLNFKRIQFTPDLMPSDIIGLEILQQAKNSTNFKFVEGPIFSNIILADEINRTPPKTQSALLEAMEERQITFAGKTFPLPFPFFVMGTQNPIEMEGTYPLPEAQLDRFLMSIHLTYPNLEHEKQIALLDESKKNSMIPKKNLFTIKNFKIWQSFLNKVTITNTLLEKTIQSVRNTRKGDSKNITNSYVEYGAGPRATQFLIKAARVDALLHGHTIVREENIRRVFSPVLRHRIKLNYVAINENITEETFLDQCLVI